MIRHIQRIAAVVGLLLGLAALPAQANEEAIRFYGGLDLSARIGLQRSLIWVNTFPAIADGNITPRTINAIREYQARLGRPQTGILRADELDRLLADAKTRALELAGDYAPPESPEIVLPGATGKVALSMAIDAFRLSGKASPHDVVVGDALSDVLSGGDTDITETVGEDDLLALERRAIMGLVRHPDTMARIEHMLETGKPLRN